jgi:hypothetical protein
MENNVIFVFISSVAILNAIYKDLVDNIINGIDTNTYIYILGVPSNEYRFGDKVKILDSKNLVSNNIKFITNKSIFITYSRSTFGEGYDNENVRFVFTFLYPMSKKSEGTWPAAGVSFYENDDELYPVLERYLEERDTHILFQCCGRCHRSRPTKGVSIMYTSNDELDRFQCDNIMRLIPITQTSAEMLEEIFHITMEKHKQFSVF